MTLNIVDAHFHFYDRKINCHPFLEDNDEKLALMWGENYQQKLPAPRDTKLIGKKFL